MLPSHRLATHPGKILLQEFLEPMKLTQADLARSLAIPLNRVNELIRGKRGVTPETALLLAGYFRNSAEFWMNLQTARDLTVARHEMRKRPVATPRNAPFRQSGLIQVIVYKSDRSNRVAHNRNVIQVRSL
jgi:antitoxin HigA-1